MSHERRDASLAVIGTSAAILLFLLAASIVVAAWYYRRQYGPTRGFPTAGRQTSFTQGPAQRPDVLNSWDATLADSHRRLDGYGWVDRQSGIVRLPIGRAMALVARGARAAPFPPANPAGALQRAAQVQVQTPIPSR